jgi:hypothetical protein
MKLVDSAKPKKWKLYYYSLIYEADWLFVAGLEAFPDCAAEA